MDMPTVLVDVWMKKSHSGSRICLSFEEYVIMPHI